MITSTCRKCNLIVKTEDEVFGPTRPKAPDYCTRCGDRMFHEKSKESTRGWHYKGGEIEQEN